MIKLRHCYSCLSKCCTRPPRSTARCCRRLLQVDGLLLLHLMNEDWGHLGIASPLIVRRLDIAMQEYRVRFERKQVCGRNYAQ